MKKVLTTVLLFAVVLAALLGIAALVERLRPAEMPAEPEETAAVEEKTVRNEMNAEGAAVITFSEGKAHVDGLGANAVGSVVTVGYPGTYRVEGTIDDGQIIVDLGDFDGAAYLILNGASIACSDGPAIHVKQADLALIHLAAGTQNVLSDGAEYTVQEGPEYRTGAGIYSADDLVIEGEGALTVYGSAADGIRSKDALTVTGGSIAVYSADDGLQASDYLSVTGGSITVGAYGDGIKTTDGYIEITGSSISVSSAGDGVAAVTELTVTDSSLDIQTHGGAEAYADIVLDDLSAKGIKGDTVTVSGGTLTFDTADDAIHAVRDITLSGGSYVIRSGDDAVHAANLVEVSAADMEIASCYEGLEAASVRLSGGRIGITAENNGVDAGEDGFVMTDGELVIEAPRGIGSDGVLSVESGSVTILSDGLESPLKFVQSGVIGGTVAAWCGSGTADVILEKGELPASLLFVLHGTAAEEATPVVLTDASGTVLYETETATGSGELLYASGRLRMGETYTLTAGDTVLEAVLGEGCAIVEQELPRSSGGWGGFPGPGMRR